MLAPGIDGDADADAHGRLMPHHHDGRVQGAQQAVRYPAGGGLGLVVLDEDRELVAAQPGDRVTVPGALAEPERDDAEHLVPDEVSECVIDGLEIVEIDEQDDHLAAATATEEVLDKSVLEQGSIGQADQRVMEGLLCEAALEGPPGGDVPALQDDPGDIRVVEEVRGLELHPCAPAVARQQLDLALGKRFALAVEEQAGEGGP